MKSVLVLIAGIGIGFGIAQRMNRAERGRVLLPDLDRRAREFTQAVSQGYRTREAELRAAVSDSVTTD